MEWIVLFFLFNITMIYTVSNFKDLTTDSREQLLFAVIKQFERILIHWYNVLSSIIDAYFSFFIHQKHRITEHII